MNDLTVIYTTANKLKSNFSFKIQEHLLDAIGGTPLITVAKGINGLYPRFKEHLYMFPTPSTHINIYREVLEGVKQARTKYIAIAEDDVLYSPQHFHKRPTRSDVFAYNTACWSIYTWSKPAIFSYSGRRNLGQLICERDFFIEAMEERFAKFKDDSKINNANWAEPGKYENNLGITVRDTELFYTDPANIMFTHPEGLSYKTLGEKKRLAPIRALEIPYWGRAEEVIKLYA